MRLGRVRRNVLLKGAVQGTRVLSLLLVVTAARQLGPGEFGKFTFAYALATLLGAALDVGMPALLVRAVARAPAETDAALGAAATLKLLLLGPAGLAFAVLPLLLGRPLDTVVTAWLLGLAIALQSFIELTVAVFTGFERLEYELGLRLLEKVSLLGLGLGGLGLGLGLPGVAGAFGLAAAAALGLGLGLVHRRLAPLHARWQGAAARALLRTLGPVALAVGMAFAATRLVPLGVALWAGDVAAGYFGAAVRVLDVTAVIPVAVVAAVYPVLARVGPGGAGLAPLARRAAEVLLVAGLAVALALGLGAGWLTAMVYGAAYLPAAPLLALLGPVAGLSFLNYLFGFVFLAVDRPGRLCAVTALGLGASLALTPLLVLSLGAAGGAWTLLGVEGVTLVAALVGLRSALGVPFGRGAATATVAAGGAAVAGLLIPPGAGRLGLTLGVYAVALAWLRPIPLRGWQAGS